MCKAFHSDLLLVLKNLHPHLLIILKKTEKLTSPHPQHTQNIPSLPPPPSPPHETTKPTPPNESAQNNHAKAGAQIDMLAHADKSIDDIS
jgi:hypothetical protein